MALSAFSYHACLRRSLIALLSRPPARNRFFTAPDLVSLRVLRSRRKYHDGNNGQEAEDVGESRPATALRTSKLEENTTIGELSERQKTHLRAELKYLTDPLKLANHIHHVLQNDNVEKALALVRLSNRAVANIVSWNHILDWNMKKGKTQVAFSVYNEMKKRGQKPDSHTYLLLLRGLADHAHYPHSLGRALSLYHSMSAPGNKVTPTIMHTNCVLKVCARANDMDSLWDIASHLPEKGPHAADHWTFTTILNNIRLNAVTGGIPSEETAEDTARRREEAIVQGRRLWEIVIQRWRAGDVKIDEELTCSMGRLLLVGSRPRDWDDVLSLIHQTMGLPRLIPRLGTAARQEVPIPRIRAPNTPSDMKNDSSEVEDPYGDPKPGAEFEANQMYSPTDIFTAATTNTGPLQVQKATQPTVKSSQIQAYAKPGPSTLSLVLEACLKMIAKQPATEYWSLLTDPTGAYAVVPDLDNFHMRLRILRQAHASTETSTLLREDLPAARIKPARKTFAIAMAACVRDSRNPNAVEAAGRILDAAFQHISEPGARTLRLFLDCIQSCANAQEKVYADAYVNSAQGQQPSDESLPSTALDGLQNSVSLQLRALGRLEPGVVSLRSLINFGDDPKQRPVGRSKSSWDEERKRERNDAIDLMKRMIAMYDRVLGLVQGRERLMGLQPSDKRKMVERKKKLSAFVTRQRQRDVKRTVATQGWRATGKGQARVGWRASSDVSDEEREREREGWKSAVGLEAATLGA